MRLIALASVLAIALAAPAWAQERAPTERQTLLDLAYALGQTHALRQTCTGADDQFWRERMVRLAEVEAADEGFDSQLKERFNSGYANGQAEFPTCTPESRHALVASAGRGQALAARMSTVTHVVRPKPTDDPYATQPEPNAQGDPPH